MSGKRCDVWIYFYLPENSSFSLSVGPRACESVNRGGINSPRFVTPSFDPLCCHLCDLVTSQCHLSCLAGLISSVGKWQIFFVRQRWEYFLTWFDVLFLWWDLFFPSFFFLSSWWRILFSWETCHCCATSGSVTSWLWGRAAGGPALLMSIEALLLCSFILSSKHFKYK